jgi:hypothetical protein
MCAWLGPFFLLLRAAGDIPVMTQGQAWCQRLNVLYALPMGRKGAFGFLADHTVRELPRGLQGAVQPSP